MTNPRKCGRVPQKAKFYYNSISDLPEYENGSHSRNKRREDKTQAGNDDFAGVHEMGHVMATTLIDGNYREASRQYNYSVPENEILDTVLSNREIMPEEDYKNLKRYSKAEADKDNQKKFKNRDLILPGAIKVNKNMLYSDGYTSGYGAKDAQEFFAEAVADVYTNGDKARKTSIGVVKEYEKRQKILTRKKFFKKKAGIFRRLWNWIKF